jgi:hypothetical protein
LFAASIAIVRCGLDLIDQFDTTPSGPQARDRIDEHIVIENRTSLP